jgi:hypothetical protein
VSVAYLVSDIQDRFRTRCALPAFTTQTNVTTADALSLVQESIRRLSGIMSDLSEEAYFATTATLTTSDGIPVVSLPTNFDKLLSPPAWLRTGRPPVNLEEANLEDVGPTDTLLNWDTRLPRYRITANVIEFFPTPQTVESVGVRYSTGLFPTVAGDTVYMGLGWDEWVVLDCCCKVRLRQDKDPSPYQLERGKIEQEILRQARKRDRAGFKQPRDVRGSRKLLDWWPDYGWWRI